MEIVMMSEILNVLAETVVSLSIIIMIAYGGMIARDTIKDTRR